MKKKLPKHAPVSVNQSAIALIDELQTHLGHPVRGRSYLHRIRVDIKRLRAWIRLIRDEEDTIGLRSMDRDLREIMKKLSSRRDRQALLETLKWLEKKTGKDENQSSLDTLGSHIQRYSQRTPLDWVNIKTALALLLVTLKQHTYKVDSMPMVRNGLQRTYKRAAKSGDKAFSGKISAGDVHEFRKWAKYLFYQLGFIQASYPELYTEALDNLEDLGNRLGRYHDLLLVKERLVQLPVKKAYADAAKRTDFLIDVRMQKLLRRSNKLYRNIFAASSSKFVMDLP